jgi:hypothetical protein
VDHRAAITELMHEYAYRIDDGDLAGVGALFRRGRLTFLGKRPVTMEGADAVADSFADVIILYDGVPRTKHLTTNVTITLDDGERTARARCYVTVMQAVRPDLPLQPIFSGNYEDRFARDDDGWYFEERLVRSDLMGDLSLHRRDLPRRPS